MKRTIKKDNNTIEKKVIKKKNMINKIKQLIVMISCFGFMFMNTVQYTFATNWGKNISDVVSDNVFYLGLAALVVVLVILLSKRSFVGALTTIFGGGLILYFIKNPEKAAEVGEKLGGVIFK